MCVGGFFHWLTFKRVLLLACEVASRNAYAFFLSLFVCVCVGGGGGERRERQTDRQTDRQRGQVDL